MVLPALQSKIESLYKIETGQAVEDYVFTCPELARVLEGGPRTRLTREKLLVLQEPDCVSISLYIDQELLEILDDNDPFERLNGTNIGAFCEALEGVSHFVYLCWNASRDRAVSCLELEMQAEVDKFLTLAGILGERGEHDGQDLHRWLFDRPSFDPALGEDELDRYQQANFYAGKYCHHLNAAFLQRPAVGTPRTLVEVRDFYRKGFHDKIRHINRFS